MQEIYERQYIASRAAALRVLAQNNGMLTSALPQTLGSWSALQGDVEAALAKMYATLPALLEPPSPPESVRTPPHGGAESDADDADTSWLGASPGEICASPEMEMCVEALRHLKNDADGRPKNAKRREDAKTRVARKLATNVGVDEPVAGARNYVKRHKTWRNAEERKNKHSSTMLDAMEEHGYHTDDERGGAAAALAFGTPPRPTRARPTPRATLTPTPKSSAAAQLSPLVAAGRESVASRAIAAAPDGSTKTTEKAAVSPARRGAKRPAAEIEDDDADESDAGGEDDDDDDDARLCAGDEKCENDKEWAALTTWIRMNLHQPRTNKRKVLFVGHHPKLNPVKGVDAGACDAARVEHAKLRRERCEEERARAAAANASKRGGRRKNATTPPSTRGADGGGAEDFVFVLNPDIEWSDVNFDTRARMRTLADETRDIFERKYARKKKLPWEWERKVQKYKPRGTGKTFNVPLVNVVRGIQDAYFKYEEACANANASAGGGGQSAGGFRPPKTPSPSCSG